MVMRELQPPKGTRDFLPEKARKLQKIIEICKSVFEKYGFSPLYTPAFENFSLLSAKGGLGEAVKDEIYYFKDKAQRELGLRFDLTMPLARIVAANPQLQKPFKRYSIDRVWRYDNPQKLRYREFWQADIDIVGSASLEADAECLAAVCECLEKLGFEDFKIRVSNRKIIEGFIESIGIKNSSDIFNTIDKLNKIGESGVTKELLEKKIDASKIKMIMNFIIRNEAGPFAASERFQSGMNEIEYLFDIMNNFEYRKYLEKDFSLVRGLEYYTSLVYEISVGLNVSIGGGGRYDSLIGLFGKETPATGISLGLDRILEIMEEKKLFKEKKEMNIFIAAASDSVRSEAVGICQKLRGAGLRSEFDLMSRSLAKQMEYAQNFDFVVIVGEKELKKKSAKLRDMRTGKEKLVKIANLAKIFG